EYAAEHILHVVHGHIHARSFRYAVYSTACIQQYDFLVSHQLCHGTVSIVFESESRSIYIIDECLQTCRDGQIHSGNANTSTSAFSKASIAFCFASIRRCSSSSSASSF